MLEVEYRSWLEGSDLDARTVEDQLSRVRRLEIAFGDLDAAFRRNALSNTLAQLQYTTEDGRRGRPVPPGIVFTGDPVTGMATLRHAARKYLQFKESRETLRLGDIVGEIGMLMGVKAVFGPLTSHVLCFGGRGDPDSRSYFSVARSVANRAAETPFILTIGGGSRVRDNLEGKVLNLAKASRSYGATSTFVEDPSEVQRLAQWPAAIALHDVWRLDGFPHLVDDLGMLDRTILAAAMDGVVRPERKMGELWERLRDWPITPVALSLPANFVDRSSATFVTPQTRSIPGGVASEEGKRRWEMQLTVERDSRLAREAKRLNAERNGMPTCEACKFVHADAGMFDAHHPTPLAVGERTTLADHLIVLCPTCHRRAHRADKLQPHTLIQLQEWIAAGRP